MAASSPILWRLFHVPADDEVTRVVAVSVEAGPRRVVHVLKHPPTVFTGPRPGGASRENFQELLAGEARMVLPESQQMAYAVAEAMVEVVEAESLRDACSALVGSALRVAGMAMFHAADLGVIAPIAAWAAEEVNSMASLRDLGEAQKLTGEVPEPESDFQRLMDWLRGEPEPEPPAPEPPPPPEPPHEPFSAWEHGFGGL